MTALVFNDALKKPLANFHISDIPTSNNQGPKTSLHTFGAHNWESKVWCGKRKQNTTAIEESLKTEHSHTHALTLYGHTVLQKKTSGDIFFFFKKQAERKKYQACVSPFFFPLFITFVFKRWGKGKWRRQVHPPRQANNSAVQKEFCRRRRLFFFFRCRGAATGVAGAVKVAPRGHAEGTSRPPFPKLPPEKNFFFATLHGYIATASQTASQTTSLSKRRKKKKLLFPAHVSLSQSGFRSAVFFPFFYLSLIKLFLNFCSRYFLRNGMCGQAKLPGPEVKLRKIYSRHPLDFS